MTTRPTLGLRWHRGTTAHVASLYPFSVHATLGSHGPYLGTDLTAHAPLCWDPFHAYHHRHTTNPNTWILGAPGNGKSALIKTLLWRLAATSPATQLAIIDPKGEYGELATRRGLTTLTLTPGGTTRLNPLDPPPGPTSPTTATLHRAELCADLCATVLNRTLTPGEDATLYTAVEAVTSRNPNATLDDLTHTLTEAAPTSGGDTTDLVHALHKLTTRTLRGMFNGVSTTALDPTGPGVHLDLSAIPLDSDALPLIMTAATGWISTLLTTPGRHRIQVIDEAWTLLANQHTANHLQRSLKLGRNYGLANICIAHRPSDLAAQADDGTATAKIAAGLLADAATTILFRHAPDQADHARDLFDLTTPERDLITHLARGRSLWKIGRHTAVLDLHLSPHERDLVDTDHHMRPDPEP